MRPELEYSRKVHARMNDAERQALGREYQEVEQALAGALRDGIEPGADVVDTLIGRHRAWVSAMWGRPCSAEAYAGLAGLYLAHPDFVARYEAMEKGFADYLATAMKLQAARSGRPAS